ncbi:MAG: glycosyltransferase family 39 protein [Candidatus Velthaea sp.]
MGYTMLSLDGSARDSVRATTKPVLSMRLSDVAARVPMRAAFLGALFAALVTLPGLGNGTLWDNSETAYGEVAREILLSRDWLVMHLNGAEWFVQPPLYFWIAAVFAKVLGVGSLAMRLPSALATIAMGGAIGYATARIAGAHAGMYAAIVVSTSLMQAIVGRLAIMDAVLDLTIAAAILWWFRAFEPLDDPTALDKRKRTAAFVGGAAAIAFGILAKGPVAPVIVIMVIGGWLMWERQVHRSVVIPSKAAVGAALLVLLAIAIPWFALLVSRVGIGAVAELIGHYTVGRYTGVIENQRGPFWYYLPVLILGFFPWIAFVPVGLAHAWRSAPSPGGSLARLAIVWTILPFIFFSLAQTKLPNYIALEFPALAIVVALWLERISNGEDRRAALISAAVVPLTVGCIAIAVILFGRDNHLTAAVQAVAPQLITLAAGMLAGSIATVAVIAIPRYRAAAPYVLAVTSLLLVNFIAFVAEPAAEPLKPVPHMAALIDAQRKPGDIVAIRGVSGGNALTFYTLPGVKTIDADDPQSFFSTICPSGTSFIVTRRDDVATLSADAARVRRTLTLLDANGRTALIRVDGRDCPHD